MSKKWSNKWLKNNNKIKKIHQKQPKDNRKNQFKKSESVRKRG